MINSLGLIRGRSDEEKETTVRKVPLLFHCVVGRDKEGDEMVVVQFMECVPALDAVDDALESAYLRWASSEGKENDSFALSRQVGGRESSSTAAFECFSMMFGRILLCILSLQSCHGTSTGFTLIACIENLNEKRESA